MKPLAANSLLQNRYLIIHHIGKGGMGEVYLSVDQRLGNPVALKRTVFRDDDMMWDAFEREARILARLRHPVLPKVSDHFSEKEEQYLVMEYISGDDMSKRLDTAKKPFPLQWVLYWADELLDALSYLHTHEPPIIHRDIKPQNLKLTNENHVVLLDFGLAKNSVAQKTSLSSSGSLVGYTPHYAPIEQIRGTGTSLRSDIYSLSATLYQLMTGTVPVDALTRAESVIGGSGDSLPSPTDLVPEISNEISAVILKGMSLNSEQRYSDAKEMQKVLREAYAVHQERMANSPRTSAEPFDGAETVVPELKASAPTDSLPKAAEPAHIFNENDVDGMFQAAKAPEPPPTLTPETLQAKPGQPIPVYDATVPPDQWAEGVTQGFTHDEMRRTTIDEDAFKRFGFDAELAARTSTAPAADEAAPTQMLGTSGDLHTAQDAAPAAPERQVMTVDVAEKPTPIRPVTRPLDPATAPVKKSSGWGMKLIAAAAVLCFLIAAVGAGAWYAISTGLLKIPGLEQSRQSPPLIEKTTAPTEVKTSDTSDKPTANSDVKTSDAEKKSSDNTFTAGEESTDGKVNSGANTANPGERKPAQPSKASANPQKPAQDKTAKPKAKGVPTDILQ
jgi:serine/threonine protein kinase